MVRSGAIALFALAIAQSATAQTTNCMTTGYGSMQHMWCNTTPAPDYGTNAQALQQSQTNFANSLAVAAEAIRERRAEEALTQQQAAQAAAQLQQAQNEQAQMQQQVAAFESAPGHERFDQMRPYMAEMIRSGRANNLQDAYTLAVAEHPGVSEVGR